MDLKAEETSYADIMQRLVRRYLFKLERARDENGKSCYLFPLAIDNLVKVMYVVNKKKKTQIK